ncbi:MAG: aminotransferase class III-fold pyridoxal phosphate-dependent enzyme, partial [Bacteroidota bacterium]
MSLIARDQKHNWHPYTQMKTAGPPLPVVRGSGANLYLEDGRTLIDAVSSWWVTVHGHAHPEVAAAIGRQAMELEQVIFAGCTHPPAVELAERLAAKLPPKISRIFYSDNGSTAVEVALKMAWQYWQNKGEQRHKILALEEAYHGDTFGAMSVSGRSVFTKAFEPLLFEVAHLPSPGAVPVEKVMEVLERECANDDVVAMIVEPLVQGAGGMMMYSPETLDRMTEYCREKEQEIESRNRSNDDLPHHSKCR